MIEYLDSVQLETGGDGVIFSKEGDTSMIHNLTFGNVGKALHLSFYERFASNNVIPRAFNKREFLMREDEVLISRSVDRVIRPFLNSERDCFIDIIVIRRGKRGSLFRQAAQGTLELLNRKRLLSSVPVAFQVEKNEISMYGALYNGCLISLGGYTTGMTADEIQGTVLGAVGDLAENTEPERSETTVPESVSPIWLRTAMATVRKSVSTIEAARVLSLYEDRLKYLIRRLAALGLRIDGREFSELRELRLITEFLGSSNCAVFSRGNTTVMASIAIDIKERSQLVDYPYNREPFFDNFMLHYYYNKKIASGDTSPGGGVRREQGHSDLIKGAFRRIVMVPSDNAVRVVCDTLRGEGSTSMAAVTAAGALLYQEGIVDRLVAGVSVGSVLSSSGKRVYMTDAMNLEDFMGDMDLKVASDTERIYSLQLDVKNVSALPVSSLSRVLSQAQQAISTIVERVGTQIQNRSVLSGNIVHSIPYDISYTGKIVGKKGQNLMALSSELGVRIDLEQGQEVIRVQGESEKSKNAAEFLKQYVSEPIAGMTVTVVNCYQKGRRVYSNVKESIFPVRVDKVLPAGTRLFISLANTESETGEERVVGEPILQ